ncbi:EF-hand domain-containing protein [Sphingosinithalassobacter sp. CS137]|uniref:EF-hand domain-containing protein n=1 Tax=Sphingosinithalassobacter sp. CS137 TaxID=2762748 RepID=UPI00165DCFBF|nr:EF-hand domain-containing protein [Sphingosinithalassobacter sp. CS137]
MKKHLLAAASATMLAAAPAAAQNIDAPQGASIEDRAVWFNVADRNNNDRLSRAEFRALRMNTVDSRWVRNYRGDMDAERDSVIDLSFQTLDRDNNGSISLTEFANVGTGAYVVAMSNATGNAATQGTAADEYWDWSPEYVTVTYYLTVTPVDTDVFEGRSVYNMNREEVGKISRIVRTEDANRYYAMIDLEGRPIYQPTDMERDNVGVPLDDILLFREGSSLLLSTRGEEFLQDAQARVIEDPQVVDRLYTVN